MNEIADNSVLCLIAAKRHVSHSNVSLFIRFVHFIINNNFDILHSVFVPGALCMLLGKEYRAQEQK